MLRDVRILRADFEGKNHSAVVESAKVLNGVANWLDALESERSQLQLHVLPRRFPAEAKPWGKSSAKLLASREKWRNEWSQFTSTAFSDTTLTTPKVGSAESLGRSVDALTQVHQALIKSERAEAEAWDRIPTRGIKGSQGASILPQERGPKDSTGNEGHSEGLGASEGAEVHSQLSQNSFSSDQSGRNDYARELIARIGLKQAELAKATGLARSYINAVVNSKKNASSSLIKHLERLFQDRTIGGPEALLVNELKAVPTPQRQEVARKLTEYLRFLRGSG